MIHIAILLTVHNRRKKTVQCLEHLKEQKIGPNVKWHVYLTDDGCTDHTAEGVHETIPDATIIKGNGQLYWNRGMYEAWKAAQKEKDYEKENLVIFSSNVNGLFVNAYAFCL